MTTETIAIIVSGAVALAAIAATWHQHFRALRHERELADLDNVRDILDEAAVALHETAYLLDDVRSFLTQHGGVSFFKTEDGTATYKALGVRGRELDALLERLSVRLGPDHRVVAAFKAADAATLGIWRAAGLLRLEPEADGSPNAANQIRKLNDDKRPKSKDVARSSIPHAKHLCPRRTRRAAAACGERREPPRADLVTYPDPRHVAAAIRMARSPVRRHDRRT